MTKWSDARRRGNYATADLVHGEILELGHSVLPEAHEIEVRDVPRREGGGSTWSIVCKAVEIP